MLGPMLSSPLALFVRPVVGQPVTRYGTGTIIGGYRKPNAPNEIEWQADSIVGIPSSEYLKYKREYDRALRTGSLKKSTAAAWKRQNEPPKQSDPKSVAPLKKAKERNQ